MPILSIERRDFLRAGAALAAGAAFETLFGCSNSIHYAPVIFDSAATWAMVPAILANIQPPTFPNKDFPVIDFGADPRGKADSQPAIQAAIQACNSAGGGRVVVPAGTYLCNGPIHLLSEVNLYLAEGALVRFGTDPADYLPAVEVRYIGIRCLNYSPFLYANGQKNIAITGKGTFDGQAYAWAPWVNLQAADYALIQQYGASGTPVDTRFFGAGHYLRPTMFEPYSCQNILVDGVTFTGSPFWTMHPTFCTNVTIRNVTVLPGIANDDGCDPDSCTNVLVEKCSFTTVDDSVSIKAGSGKDASNLPPCSNIVLKDCSTISTSWGAFTIGTNVSGGVENVFVENYSAANSLNAYLVKGNRDLGGYVRDIHIRNSSAVACHHLLALIPAYFNTNFHSFDPPTIGPVSMENVTCEDASVSVFRFDGLRRSPILEVYLDSIATESSPLLAAVSNSQVGASGLTLGGRPVKF